MSQHSEHFDIDDEFLAESESTVDLDRNAMERAERRNRQSSSSIKRGKAAWSKLEDVLAERRLAKELGALFED